MLSKIEFLKKIDEILTNKHLISEEETRLRNIKENPNILNEHEAISVEILINTLDLQPIKGVTDEDGYYKEFVKIINQKTITETEIFYLIKSNQVSCLHSLDTNETWTWLGGKDILIFIFENEKISEICLNADCLTYSIPANTLFGAKLIAGNNENFAWVSCKCIPGFKPEFYHNPTSQELEFFVKNYPKYKKIIKELTPQISNSNNNIFRSIFNSLTCCIGIKQTGNDEHSSLIARPPNSR